MLSNTTTPQVGSAATGAAGQAAGLNTVNGGFKAFPIKELINNAEIGKKILSRM